MFHRSEAVRAVLRSPVHRSKPLLDLAAEISVCADPLRLLRFIAPPRAPFSAPKGCSTHSLLFAELDRSGAARRFSSRYGYATGPDFIRRMAAEDAARPALMVLSCTMPDPPNAAQFLSRFLEAFSECHPEQPEARADAWENWTAFITGKQSKNGGFWQPLEIERCVLPLTAKRLGLNSKHEYLNLDLALFFPGATWGNLIAIEHENEIGGFSAEIIKLMSVLAPLKIGITYDWQGNSRKQSDLEEMIRILFGTRHPLIRENPETEYLFLLGVMRPPKILQWKYLAFAVREMVHVTQMKHFQQTTKEFSLL